MLGEKTKSVYLWICLFEPGAGAGLNGFLLPLSVSGFVVPDLRQLRQINLRDTYCHFQ